MHSCGTRRGVKHDRGAVPRRWTTDTNGVTRDGPLTPQTSRPLPLGAETPRFSTPASVTLHGASAVPCRNPRDHAQRQRDMGLTQGWETRWRAGVCPRGGGLCQPGPPTAWGAQDLTCCPQGDRGDDDVMEEGRQRTRTAGTAHLQGSGRSAPSKRRRAPCARALTNAPSFSDHLAIP